MANPNLQKIIKLTSSQYDLLSNGGSITHQGITYTGLNDNYLYLIQEENIAYSAGTGLQLSGTTFSANLKSTTSLGTIGTTSKLYAVGVDASGKLAVNVPWTDTHYTNYLQIKGNGTEAVKFTQNADKSLNLKPGTNVSISAAANEITISATDTNTATAADNILDGSNNGTQITYAPYAAQQSKLSFDTSTTAPTRTDRLNLNGSLYATKFNVAGKATMQYNSTEDCVEFIFA